MVKLNTINRNGENCRVGFFGDVRQVTGTLKSSTGVTTVCELPAGYTYENIMFLSLTVETSSSRRECAFGYSSAVYPYVAEDDSNIYLRNNDSGITGRSFSLIIAHL